MDFHMNIPSEPGKVEQIVSQFLLKTLHIILESRIPSLKPQDRIGNDFSSNSRVKKSDKWFNLGLGDHPAALENLNFWHRSLMDPMVIDIIVVNRAQDNPSENDSVETVVERWVVQYENQRSVPVQPGDISSSYKKMYKKSIILLRTMYSMMRLLPAYRIFRHLSLSSRSPDHGIIYKVSCFSDPFSREEEKEMKSYSFLPVEAVNGRLCVSVMYRSNLSDFNLENSTSFPPVIIADYVGSPATDIMRAFPPMEKVSRAASFSLRGARLPLSAPSQRPHSWSGGIHGAAHVMNNQPFSGSFVPNDDPWSPSNTQSHRLQNYRLPPCHQRTSSFDESLSPPFSPFSSPSPPAHLLNYSPSHSRMRSETAPVAIPHPMMNRSPRYLSPNFSDPSRHSLPPLSPRSTRPDGSSHGSPSPSGTRPSRKLDVSRSGDSYTGLANQSFGSKLLKDNKDDSGRFSGLLSSGSSPRVGFSRTSSRLSFQDDLDECDFSCPFDVDDMDTSDTQTSQSMEARKGMEYISAFSMGKKSQDAAVGALVHILRTAPPLRQDSSCYSTGPQNTEREGNIGSASEFFVPRRGTDLLDELKSYRDLKELLLSKSENGVMR